MPVHSIDHRWIDAARLRRQANVWKRRIDRKRTGFRDLHEKRGMIEASVIIQEVKTLKDEGVTQSQRARTFLKNTRIIFAPGSSSRNWKHTGTIINLNSRTEEIVEIFSEILREYVKNDGMNTLDKFVLTLWSVDQDLRIG